MKGRLIVTEGIDAAGKTTLAKGLTKQFGAVYYKTPGGKTLEERAMYDDPSVTVRDRFNFYFTACKNDIKNIQEMQEDGRDVVCDRLLSSTLVHHQSLDPDLDMTEAEELNAAIDKTQILLVSTRAEIIRRLAQRDTVTRFEKDPDGFIYSQELFMRQKNHIIIPTHMHDVKETLQIASTFITSKQ